jgi:hypothetical protein
MSRRVGKQTSEFVRAGLPDASEDRPPLPAVGSLVRGNQPERHSFVAFSRFSSYFCDVIRVGVLLAAAALGSSSAAYSTFRGGGVSFRYPARWQVSAGSPSLHWTGIANVSTDPLHAACSDAACGWPLSHLSRGGVLVMVGQGAARVRSSSRRVSSAVARGGSCREIGADETVTASVRTRSGRVLSVLACLRRPGLARTRAEVLRLAASLRVS